MAENNQAQERVAFIKTINTKYGPMEKLSLELNKIGKVAEKDGKLYLILDPNSPEIEKYEKDGAAPRWFLKFVLNTFKSVKLDQFVPEPQDGNNNAGQASQEDVDDLPF